MGHSRPRRSVCAPGALAHSSNRKPDIQKRTTTMTYFSRKTRRVSPGRATAKPRLEPLEERIALSGFGPADGAYIVESWIASYSAVQIQPGDQKIVAAGTMSPYQAGSSMAIARYDPLGNPDTTYGTGG